jgi:putative membrane protein
MWWMMNGTLAWWGWLVGLLWMLVFWGGLVLLIVWVVKQLSRGPERPGTPLDIAKERYARGEISREQYEQLKADLTR